MYVKFMGWLSSQRNQISAEQKMQEKVSIGPPKFCSGDTAKSSSAWDASQGRLLSKHLDTSEVLGIVMWTSKVFFGWFRWKMRKSLVNSQGFMGEKIVQKESVERKWKKKILQFWIKYFFFYYYNMTRICREKKETVKKAFKVMNKGW